MIQILEVSLIDWLRKQVSLCFTDQLVIKLIDCLDMKIVKVDDGQICNHDNEHLRSNQELLMNRLHSQLITILARSHHFSITLKFLFHSIKDFLVRVTMHLQHYLLSVTYSFVAAWQALVRVPDQLGQISGDKRHTLVANEEVLEREKFTRCISIPVHRPTKSEFFSFLNFAFFVNLLQHHEKLLFWGRFTTITVV